MLKIFFFFFFFFPPKACWRVSGGIGVCAFIRFVYVILDLRFIVFFDKQWPLREGR